MDLTRSIRLAAPADLPFIVHLQKVWSNNVGFLPACVHERYIDHRAVLLVVENGQPAGYLNWTLTKRGLVRLPQVAVEPALLRTTIGTRLMRRIEKSALRASCACLRLTSRADLPANLFWPELGFTVTAILTPPNLRRRPILEWTKSLVPASELALATIARNTGRRQNTFAPNEPLTWSGDHCGFNLETTP